MRTYTPKQRLLSLLHREPVDRAPFICPGGMMNMAVTEVMDEVGHAWPEAHSDAERMARVVGGMHDLAGVENLGAPFCMTIEAEGMGAEVFMGTRETEPRVVEYVMEDLSELDRLSVFEPRQGRAAIAVEATSLLAERYPDVPVIADLTGPISLATSLIEPLTFYRAMHREKTGVHRLMELSVDAAIAFGDAMVSAGADVVCVADPSGTGELIGPRAFDEFALPYINEITDHFTRRGVLSIVHICGDVRGLGDVLPRLKAPVISVDSIVPMRAMRYLAPDHLSMGNISTYLLEYGKPKTLANLAASRVEAGVDIIAPACGIGARTPLRNIRAIADTVAAVGRAALEVG